MSSAFPYYTSSSSSSSRKPIVTYGQSQSSSPFYDSDHSSTYSSSMSDQSTRQPQPVRVAISQPASTKTQSVYNSQYNSNYSQSYAQGYNPQYGAPYGQAADQTSQGPYQELVRTHMATGRRDADGYGGPERNEHGYYLKNRDTAKGPVTTHNTGTFTREGQGLVPQYTKQRR
ncbi:MAG: hypothetical protein M1814_000094 [Vezdaea aestivalis]|nr:MAG: hypothetical protein M1814_000094 [Vezdaea aestivalis]